MCFFCILLQTTTTKRVREKKKFRKSFVAFSRMCGRKNTYYVSFIRHSKKLWLRTSVFRRHHDSCLGFVCLLPVEFAAIDNEILDELLDRILYTFLILEKRNIYVSFNRVKNDSVF